MVVLARHRVRSEYWSYSLSLLESTGEHNSDASARTRRDHHERAGTSPNQSVDVASCSILDGTEWHELGKRDAYAQLWHLYQQLTSSMRMCRFSFFCSYAIYGGYSDALSSARWASPSRRGCWSSREILSYCTGLLECQTQRKKTRCSWRELASDTKISSDTKSDMRQDRQMDLTPGAQRGEDKEYVIVDGESLW